MKSIVVASDLSERSRPAVKRAMALATSLQATLNVVHVVDGAMPSELANQVKREAKKQLSDQVSTDLCRQACDHVITVVAGDPVEEIHTLLQSTKADLLIVGVHRRRVFMDQIRETTMEYLVRTSRLPVLLVAGQAERAYTHVLGGVDLSNDCAGALHKAKVIAPEAKFTLFHAHEVSFRKEAERDYETWKAVSHLPPDLPDPVFVEARANDAVYDLMKEGDYDLLAIGAHTRQNIGRYFLGKFSSGLIRQPPCDILVAR